MGGPLVLSEDKLKNPNKPVTFCTERKELGFQGRGWRVTGRESEWLWPWSALAAPSPCGGVVTRGSGGEGEEAEKRGQRHWVSHGRMQGPWRQSFP